MLLTPLLERALLWAQSKGIEVHLDVSSDCPSVFADPQRLWECFAELVANARYWSNLQEKRIEVSVRWAPRESLTSPGLDQSQAYLLITFADNGLGVPGENKRLIFEPFFSTDTQGTGLGLALVKRAILLHKGDIVECGRPGFGARFEIFLPVAEQATQEALGNAARSA